MNNTFQKFMTSTNGTPHVYKWRAHVGHNIFPLRIDRTQWFVDMRFKRTLPDCGTTVKFRSLRQIASVSFDKFMFVADTAPDPTNTSNNK